VSEDPAQGDRRAQAEEAIATRLTRHMRATTSPLGPLTDPYLVGLPTSVLVLGAAISGAMGWLTAAHVPIVVALCALPVVASLGASIAIGDARGRVVGWMATLPFDIINVNGLLDGVGEALVVRFVGELPHRDELNTMLGAIHSDCFALLYEEEDNELGIKIGVSDSRRNPTAAHRRRYLRVQAIVEQVLLPLHEARGIAWVRIS